MIPHLGFLILLSGCVTSTPSKTSMGESALSIATLDLFSQIDIPKNAQSWVGDWEFRRDRLELIDTEIRETRPDIMILQNALVRVGSKSESDELILKAGSLARYDWKGQKIGEIRESAEEKYLSVSGLRPLLMKDLGQNEDESVWTLGSDGAVSLSIVDTGDEPILVANIVIPSRKDQVGLWYAFVQDRIEATLKKQKLCKSRLVVAGYLPRDQDSRKSQTFFSSLELQDTATGFCQNAEKCQTASSTNGIYAATRLDQGVGQFDRILIHRDGRVISGGLLFTQFSETSHYKEIYGLARLWPSQRYGWLAKVRLPRCGK
jgi:hypothetical protein